MKTVKQRHGMFNNFTEVNTNSSILRNKKKKFVNLYLGHHTYSFVNEMNNDLITSDSNSNNLGKKSRVHSTRQGSVLASSIYSRKVPLLPT